MTPLQEFILAEARSWIGTPYRHQASVKGAGADCLGLLRGIWRAAFGAEPEAVPSYTADWAEPSGQEVLGRAAERHFLQKSLDDAEPGDVLLFRMKDQSIAKHLGIAAEVGDRPSFVHAYTGHGVVESPLSEPWKRRIVARYAFHDRKS
jgi:NlpC/P60 family putative phage cell wall peptidase